MTRHVAVIGGGPAGLMAADVVSAAGVATTVYDRMPSLGRKLLMAGRGGLNLTHSEDFERLLARYGAARDGLEPALRAFAPAALIAFAEGLGQPTFVGSSGRVFPQAMKSSPLLRAWLVRLGQRGVTVVPRRRWLGHDAEGCLQFATESGAPENVEADAVILALGGASWARLGSDGAWAEIVRGWGVEVAPLTATNCGVAVPWSERLREVAAGVPLKRIALTIGGATARGEAVITTTGLEGGAVYALSPAVRRALTAGGPVRMTLDLRPDMSAVELVQRLAKPRGKQSLSTYLRKALALPPAAIALLHEGTRGPLPAAPAALAALIKAVPISVSGLAAIDRAISTAGGVKASELDRHLMLTKRPGVFVAGEMLDWEAPTGGYLLQACFATGHVAGHGALAWLASLDAGP